ncbi:NmrA family transcriptional regulator [Nocardiopsis sp. EMB25]|uniref:NmrA family transcriptional regulator n=1 Tax=Nocardiopsis sp. EMB25 TaxID=2835867 RepID=UPI00228475DF|nr:NmrA family transcriptional regulator [Nocardiopsis sp. EMB25]MCY9785337.1 NmrA family transcriptional regulator [Nocardiopsis sp. EMB25]
MTTHERILVTGGTGMTGRRVTDLLEQRGVDTRVGSRSGTPPFEWHDTGTWDPVLEGVTGVYLCYHPDLAFPGAAETVAAFAARAAERGVRRAVLLSGRGEDGALAAEHAVREAFPATTLARSSYFAQNFSESFLTEQVRAGTTLLPVPDVAEPFIDLDDLAEVAVTALTGDGHAGRTYDLTGPRSLTFTEAAAVLSEASGRTVEHRSITPQEYVGGAVAEGLPAELAQGLVEIFQGTLDGRNTEPTEDVGRVLGRPAGDFADYARRAARTGVWA